MLNLTTVTDQHSSQGTELSQHTYQTIMHQPMLNLTTVTDQHSSQGTKLSRHTYQTTRTNQRELNDCRCELTEHSRSTFFPRYQTQPTHLPNKTHRPMLNLTTVPDQHSSQGTKLSRHTYQTTSTNQCELIDCRCELNVRSRSTFFARYQTQLTHLPNQTHRLMLNLTTVTDQHSSQSTKLSRHTYQTKCTNQC